MDSYDTGVDGNGAAKWWPGGHNHHDTITGPPYDLLIKPGYLKNNRTQKTCTVNTATQIMQKSKYQY